MYHIYPKYSDKHACTNRVDSDKTPQNAAADKSTLFATNSTIITYNRS